MLEFEKTNTCTMQIPEKKLERTNIVNNPNPKLKEAFINCLRTTDVKPITQQDLFNNYRIKGETAVIFKQENVLWVSQNIKLLDQIKAVRTKPINKITSLCLDCIRCSARGHDLGGCDKIADMFAENLTEEQTVWRREGIADVETYIYVCKRIEKYDFIKLGYETIGFKENSFSVIHCADYIKDTNKPKPVDINTYMALMSGYYEEFR